VPRNILQINELDGAREGESNPHGVASDGFESKFDDFAARRKRAQHWYNILNIIKIQAYCGLQAVAQKCRKVGNEQPSKQPLDLPGGFNELADSFSQPLQQFSGCFGPQASEWSTVADCTVFGESTSFHLQRPFTPTKPWLSR
jgi:hypothetical protein